MTWQRLLVTVLLSGLCGNVCGRTIKVVWLAPQETHDGLRASSSVGSLVLGVETMVSDPDILPGDDFSYVFVILYNIALRSVLR